jgi:2-hydroxychromene-2-carboxylate isomerase
VRHVAFHFDFISPYSYLALVKARRFEAETGARFDVRPIVYAKVLDSTGLVGPVEVEVKRRYTFADVLRCAHEQGVPLVGPPRHPFRSLEALRTVVLHLADERALDLAVALSSACWGEGRDLTDVKVIEDVAARAGFDVASLAERIATPEVKDALAATTAEAIEAGVFGVPTFIVGGEMFWGQDRMPHLAAYLAGRMPPARDLSAPLVSRPRGADRDRRPK